MSEVIDAFMLGGTYLFGPDIDGVVRSDVAIGITQVGIRIVIAFDPVRMRRIACF